MFNDLFTITERLGTRGWRTLLEGSRRLLGLCQKAQLCVFGRVTKEHCLASLAMVRETRRLYKSSGPLFLGQYLKHVSLHLMWYWGGDLSKKAPMKTYVSLTRSGIPRFIPPYYRKLISRRSNPLIVRFVLSFCSLAKLILVWPAGPKVKPDTIHIPAYSHGEPCQNLCVELLTRIPAMISAYTNGLYKSIPLRLGFVFNPVWSSGPNTYAVPGKDTRSRLDFGFTRKLSIWHTLPVDATALMTLWKPEFLRSIGDLWFKDRDHQVEDGWENPILPDPEGGREFGRFIERLIRPAETLWWPYMRTRPENGRFGTKLEGAQER